MAKAAYATAKEVEREIAPEYKNYVINTIPVVISNLGAVYDLIGAGSGYAGIQQGVSINDRTGDSIKLHRMVARGIIKRSNAASIETVRMIIFKGKSEEGASYVPADILDSIDVYSNKNEQNRYNSKFLYDEIFVLDDVKSQYHEIKLNMELNWDTQFEPGIPSVSNQGVWMLLLSSASAGNQPSWEATFRTSYTDA